MTEHGPSNTPLDLPLECSGTVLIEASAGTGKTYALTTLVARLVVEAGREIDEILVVTFTRAATAELKDRIRRTLHSARTAMLEGASVIDPQAAALRERWTGCAGADPRAAARRLDAALSDIDRASVYTIHSFCQRVLGDLAFEGAFPFGFEVHGDDADVVAGAVRDFWRRRLHDASPLLMRYALDHAFFPSALAEWAARWMKPGLHIIEGETPAEPLDAHEAIWRAAFEALRARWKTHEAAFSQEMRHGKWLNRARYRSSRVEECLAGVAAALADPEPALWEEDRAGWFGRECLSKACKRGFGLPDNPLFDAFDTLEEASRRLRAAFDIWLRRARKELIAEAHPAAQRRVREERKLRYDDLLVEVEAALRGERGARLAESIRRVHPCALIDEYQDTDILQARIFARVYGGLETGREGEAEASGPATAGEERSAFSGGSRPTPGAAGAGTLFVVGDPKQSIYRFRGADIFAYLGTRRRARQRLALGRNWRSVPGLVAAVNALFAAHLPFVLPDIEYRAATAARSGEADPPGGGADEGGPFELRLLSQGPKSKTWSKGDAEGEAAADAAAEIALLLDAEPEPPGGAGPLESARKARARQGSEIAVLVPTRRHGQRMAAALRERGVRAVEVNESDVFDTGEAEHLERLLRCLAEPVSERVLRGALAGDLFALDTRAMNALEEDDEAWSGWRERLRVWRNDWESRGIGALLLRLLEHEGGAEHLLRYRDGARRLTNYRHLAELLAEAERGGRRSPSGLAAWLGRRRQMQVSGRDENALLRLDSDEHCVRILTIHGSKGLEFPVVFCPFAWYVSDPTRKVSDLHTAYHERAGEGYREILNLAPDDAARARARCEAYSEALRLLYVALTRAKERCVVTWGHVKGAEHAPLTWLLHRGPFTAAPASGGDLEAVAERFRKLEWSPWRDEVEAFAGRCPEGFSVTPLTPGCRMPSRHKTAPPPALAARELLRPLRRVRQMTSYSALSAELARGPAGQVLVERPDHDAGDAGDAPPFLPTERGEALRGDDDPRSVFTFPRGGTAGSCLHRIFERLDRAPPGGPAPDLDALCRDALLEFGFSDEWRAVVRSMVAAARSVRLREPEGEEQPPGGRSIPPHETGGGDRGPEMPAIGTGAARATRRPGKTEGKSGPDWIRRHDREKGFRLSDPVRRIAEMEFHFPVTGLARRRLADCLVEHGYPDPFGEGVHGGEDLPPIEGFLRGFIDLTVEHEGRWYLLDYKSNWLGPASADYAPAALAHATRASGYPLQYLIYLVALHRHLGARLPEYEYERHIGGVFYLYLRGMDPAAGMKRGVYFDRPSRACIDALDACFRGADPESGR